MRPRLDATTAFTYPDNRLLGLQDLISEDLMRNPDMLNHDGEPYLLVIKNGNTTGVTIGRATDIFSYVREYFNNGLTGPRRSGLSSPMTTSPDSSSPPAIQVLSSLTPATASAASSLEVPARRSP